MPTLNPCQARALAAALFLTIPLAAGAEGLAYRDGASGTDVLLPGATFSRVYDKAGMFEYVCAVHPYMTGRVVVKAP